MKKFIFKFWAEVGKEKKYLTLKLTPAQWPDTDCPNGYLFKDFSIFVNEEYEVIEKKSSSDWKDWFKIYLSEGLLLQVFSTKCRVCLNLPEPVQEDEENTLLGV